MKGYCSHDVRPATHLAIFKSPLAMGRDAFKSKHASSVSISGVIDTGVNSNNERTYYPFTVKKIYIKKQDMI